MQSLKINLYQISIANGDFKHLLNAELVKEALRREKIMTDLISIEDRTGWWIKEDSRRMITVSDYIRDTYGLPTNEITYEDFMGMVREDYRDRIHKEVISNDLKTQFDLIFPSDTLNGPVWQHVKELKCEIEDGFMTTYGRIQIINDPEVHSPKQASTLRTNNLLHELNHVSEILLSFLQTDDPGKVVHETLRNILRQFKAGRIYIFEYDFEKQIQVVTYEVVDKDIHFDDIFSDLPIEQNPWWTNQIIGKREPVIISSLEDLPPEGEPDKKLLAIQDINSSFAIPLITNDKVWGYIGIDVIGGSYTWTKDDMDWLKATFNIVSLCVQLQRSENKAKLDKAYLENLYAKMPLGYLRLHLIYNEDGEAIDYIYKDVNSASDRLFGYPLTQQIGKNVSEIAPVEHITRNLGYLTQIVNKEGYIEIDYYVDTADTDRYSRMTMYSIQKDEVICLFSDITEAYHSKQSLIKAKEKAEVSDRLKSAFLANMSHEIRTPLNAIVGFSDLLTTSDDREERLIYAEIVRKNNDLLLQLISDILDISKIEAGTLDVYNNHVNINQMCKEVIQFYNLKTKDNLVKVTFDENLPPYILFGDKNRLTQILNNFINNALKFTTVGGIFLGYHLVGEDKIKFYVRDTGCGIAEKDLDSVFERFVKLNSFVTGTGLGLPICKSLVEQMGGEIGVESEIGKGSYFWFTHPFQPELQTIHENTAPKKSTQPIPTNESHDPRKPVVLIAEDTESNYILLANILKKKYNVVWAQDGRETIDMFNQLHSDIILMDIRMPLIDGIEATKMIRATGSKIPIVAVTAFAYDSDKERVLEAGCNAYISKPIKHSALLQIIGDLLEESK